MLIFIFSTKICLLKAASSPATFSMSTNTKPGRRLVGKCMMWRWGVGGGGGGGGGGQVQAFHQSFILAR